MPAYALRQLSIQSACARLTSRLFSHGCLRGACLRHVSRYVPVAYLLQFPGNDVRAHLHYPGYRADGLVDHTDKLIGVSSIDLGDEVAISDRPGYVAHLIQFHEAGGDALKATGGYVEHDVCDGGVTQGVSMPVEYEPLSAEVKRTPLA